LVANGYLRSRGIRKVIENVQGSCFCKNIYTKKNIDYREIFSSISFEDSFWTIMALMTHFDLVLYQIGVKIVFLNGNIDETIYIVQPVNFIAKDSNDLICKYNKFIYGLKQASQ